MRLSAMGVALVLLATVSLAGCTSDKPNSTNDANGTGGSTGSQVLMEGIAFKPVTLNVTKGTKVTWKNMDTAAHTVTSDDASGPLKSELIQKGGTYSYTFDAAGTFEYHCEPHPNMKAKIVVS